MRHRYFVVDACGDQRCFLRWELRRRIARGWRLVKTFGTRQEARKDAWRRNRREERPT